MVSTKFMAINSTFSDINPLHMLYGSLHSGGAGFFDLGGIHSWGETRLLNYHLKGESYVRRL